MDFYDPTVAAAYAAYRPPLHAPILRPEALILTYDFEVDLGDVPARLGCVSTWEGPPYDHRAGLDAHAASGFSRQSDRQGRLDFTCTPEAWTALLLALPIRCPLSEAALIARVRQAYPHGRIQLEAAWWGSVWRCDPQSMGSNTTA